MYKGIMSAEKYIQSEPELFGTSYPRIHVYLRLYLVDATSFLQVRQFHQSSLCIIIVVELCSVGFVVVRAEIRAY